MDMFEAMQEFDKRYRDREEEKESFYEKHISWIFYRMRNFYYERIRDPFQRVVRKNHCSDTDIWNLFSHMADIILPKLQAFIDANRVAYSGSFVEYSPPEDDPEGYDSSIGMDKKQYDEVVASGKMEGGGPEAWEATLQEMLYAFDYVVNYDNGDRKKERAFCEKWNMPDPFEEIEENKNWSYYYRSPDNMFCSSGDEIKEEGYEYIGKGYSYHNIEKGSKLSQRAQKGFELFGKHYFSLWD